MNITKYIPTRVFMLIYDFFDFISKPMGLKNHNGLMHLKIDKTSCDNEYCATVYHYWLYGQNDWGWWIKVRQKEFKEEL